MATITTTPTKTKLGPPLWLLLELTYKCPLQCPYCSNPLNLHHYKDELCTDDWLQVLTQARALGALQLGLSGGEPLLRKDLLEIITHAHKLGYYINLITSGVGLTEAKIQAFKKEGLDHIQLSFQGSDAKTNEKFAGSDVWQQKIKVAKLIKKYDFSMVLNFVLHRQNIHQISTMLDLALSLKADFVELATTQYYGWALHNRAQLLPSKAQLIEAEEIAHHYQQQYPQMKTIYVVPDYYENRPKACMNGWGSIFLTISPDGVALPCHSAKILPDIDFPNVKTHSIKTIWQDSKAFNMYRGFDWMLEPCKSCPEKEKDFGGCRCQAYLLTQNARNADPVCSLSPEHDIVVDAVDAANQTKDIVIDNMLLRNPRNAQQLLP